MNVVYRLLGVMVIVTFMLAGCGGGGAGETAEEEFAQIKSLSDIPENLLDPREYDLTTKSVSAALVVTKDIMKAEAIGKFSRAGCETNRMKKDLIRQAILPEMILCYMRGFERASGTQVAGDGRFNYLRGDDVMQQEVQGPSEVDEFRPRMAMKVDGNVFTLVMCNGLEKSMELVIMTVNNVYAGHAINSWGDGSNSKLEFSTDGPPTNFTAAIFTQSVIEDSIWWKGFGSMTMEATPAYNVLYGYHNEESEFNYAGSLYAKFDASQGTAKFRSDAGSYPAPTVQEAYDQCVMYEGEGNCGEIDDWLNYWLNSPPPDGCGLELTADSCVCFKPDGQCPEEAVDDRCSIVTGEVNAESFSIDRSDPLNLIFSVASTSVYAADVEAALLSDSSVQPAVEFTAHSSEVNCAESNSWPPLTLIKPPDVADCQAIEAEMNDWDSGKLCEELEAAANGGGS